MAKPTTLVIGDRVLNFENEQAKNDYILSLAAKNAALEAKIAEVETKIAAATVDRDAERPFKIDASMYSLEHASTKDFLRGKPKGSVKISGGTTAYGVPFGIDIFPAQFRYLLEHKDEILTFMDANKAMLERAEADAKALKASKGKAAATATAPVNPSATA